MPRRSGGLSFGFRELKADRNHGLGATCSDGSFVKRLTAIPRYSLFGCDEGIQGRALSAAVGSAQDNETGKIIRFRESNAAKVLNSEAADIHTLGLSECAR